MPQVDDTAKADNTDNETVETPQEEQPSGDVFGTSPDEDETKENQEDDKGKGDDDKSKVEDVENHPLVKELRTQLSDVKREYGSNLSGQREKISKLEEKLEEAIKGKGGEEEKPALFTDIKTSKDLKKEEREEMTETEIKQYDEIATLKEGINKLAELIGENSKMISESGKKQEVDRNSTVRTMAKAVAQASVGEGKDATELTNQIIEEFNLFDQSKIEDADLESFVKKAAGQVSDYEPPKEQTTKRGGTVKNTKKKDDPFGVEKIIDEVTSDQSGGYAL